MALQPSRFTRTELTLSELSPSGSQAVVNRCTGYTSVCDGPNLAPLTLVEDRTSPVPPYTTRRICGNCRATLERIGFGPFIELPEPRWLARARSGLLGAKDYTDAA